ncbi:MAG: tRNA lysidine(34) synthetase TilS, partial [Candidatus Omnitrophica bacterium]|nr:tRNA lysidine(34) synthetase TilS [Candidatus Omnitrophota bacterium]
MLLKKIKATIERYRMLKKGDSVVIGVSGGPDSIALLYILNELKRELNLKLFIAHLNHMIRKKAALDDAAFVKKHAEKLNLPIIIESEDIPKIARDSKLSIEEAARNTRYDFYVRVAESNKANKIALGHTEDDQAETILMRLIKGSGLLGLSGIPPTRTFKNQTIIRPLINISKDEIKRFLKLKNISFREDATNVKPIYFRNKIRHRLLPFLKKRFSPDINKILAATAKNLRIDYDYLLKISTEKFKRHARCIGGEIRISLKFQNEDLAVQRMMIREAIRRVKGDLNSVTYSHWEDLNNLLNKRTRWSIALPGNVVVRREKNSLVFLKRENRTKNDLGNVIHQLELPGDTKIPEIKRIIKANFVKPPLARFREFLRGRKGQGKLKKLKNEEYFDFEKLELPIFVRFRKPKDKIKPLGMDKYKRVKQLFIDE